MDLGGLHFGLSSTAISFQPLKTFILVFIVRPRRVAL